MLTQWLEKIPFFSPGSPAKTNVQGWMPIKDIDQYQMVRRDQMYVMAIRLYPENIDLLSKKERRVLIHRLQEVINGLQGHYQFFCVGRPVDLDGYMTHLEQLMRNTTDPIRKKIIQSQIREAAQTAISGDALETLFYMLFASLNKAELMEQVKKYATDLQQHNFGCHICDSKELMDMNFVFTHPVQAAYERMPEDTQDYVPAQLLHKERMKPHG